MFSFNEYLLLSASYLIGSIPFGVIIAHIYGLGDITKLGSGNTGATNLTRVGGKKLGAITFLLDFLKCFLPVTLYRYIFPESEGYLLCALLVITGHIFPIFNRFIGGKGVASSFGALLAISPLLFGLVITTWILAYFITKISSIGAILSFSLMPIYNSVIAISYKQMGFTIILSLIIFCCHLSNIKRLLNGHEKKIQ